MMKTFYFILLTAVALSFPAVPAAGDGSLEKMQQRVAAMGTVEIEVQADGSCVTVVSDGEKYRMESDGMSVWCDGESQWVYNGDTQEITIVPCDPGGDDVAENPAVALSSAILKSYSVVSDGDGLILLRARRNRKVAYQEIEVRVDKSYLPVSLSVRNSSGQSAVMSITAVKPVRDPAKVRFRPSDELLDGCQVTDLR